MEKIKFDDARGTLSFCVLEQTVLNGKTYILVTEAEEGDADAFVLRDDSRAEDDEALYSFVTEEDELNAVGAVFQKLMEDEDSEVIIE